MTADDLRPLVESECDSEVLAELVWPEKRVLRSFGRQSEGDG